MTVLLKLDTYSENTKLIKERKKTSTSAKMRTDSKISLQAQYFYYCPIYVK